MAKSHAAYLPDMYGSPYKVQEASKRTAEGSSQAFSRLQCVADGAVFGLLGHKLDKPGKVFFGLPKS